MSAIIVDPAVTPGLTKEERRALVDVIEVACELADSIDLSAVVGHVEDELVRPRNAALQAWRDRENEIVGALAQNKCCRCGLPVRRAASYFCSDDCASFWAETTLDRLADLLGGEEP